jgi:hypothetical protein
MRSGRPESPRRGLSRRRALPRSANAYARSPRC